MLQRGNFPSSLKAAVFMTAANDVGPRVRLTLGRAIHDRLRVPAHRPIFLERRGTRSATIACIACGGRAPAGAEERPRRLAAVSRPRPQTATAVNHVWADDLVSCTCADGQMPKCLRVIDEFTRECLAIEVADAIRSGRVIGVLTQFG